MTLNPLKQWRRQAWGMHWGTCLPRSLRIHANFAAVQTMAVLIFLPSSVSLKLDRQSHPQNPESNSYLILHQGNIGQMAFTSG